MAIGCISLPVRLWARLTRDKHASTFIRLAESQHVADLQLIFWSSLALMAGGSAFVAAWHQWVDAGQVIGSGALIAAIVGTGCGVLVWAYQTGSARLGIVDLFGCEISTICRVVAIADAAAHYTALYREPPAQSINFSSQEHYTPVFDNNSKDLEVLEARTVERITEFYTYLKAMRDYLRLLGGIANPQEDSERWRTTMRSVIYMLFLMLESARGSVDRLIEFEPERVQNTITILLSELVAYGALLDAFEAEGATRPSHDARIERLRSRKDGYEELVPRLYARISSMRDEKDWEHALALIGELDQRYFDVFGTWLHVDRAGAVNAEPPPQPISVRQDDTAESATTR